MSYLSCGEGSKSADGKIKSCALEGGAGNDTLSGVVGNDWLYGQAGNDALYGVLGNDMFYGGLGNDMLKGGAGKDTFVFEKDKNSGHDIITDFSPYEDKVHFTYAGTYDDLLSKAVQRGVDVIITFDEGNTLTLEYAHLSSLTPDGVIWG